MKMLEILSLLKATKKAVGNSKRGCVSFAMHASIVAFNLQATIRCGKRTGNTVAMRQLQVQNTFCRTTGRELREVLREKVDRFLLVKKDELAIV